MASNSIRGGILNYANANSSFGISDLHSHLNRDDEVNRSTLRRQLSELVKESTSRRVAKARKDLHLRRI